MKLEELSSALPDSSAVELIGGPTDVDVDDVAFDSRRVGPGTLFVCVPGMVSDGHDFAAAAIEAGAVALVVERVLDLDVPQLLVPDARATMGPLAARLFGDPSRELTVVGITGTNGKTTTTFLVRSILEAAGIRCGLLGTVKQVIGGVEEEVVRTTPEAIDVQRLMRRMLDAGDRACVMEVSSHALAMGRAAAIEFDVAAFTNLTQDHLDFHADMEDYFAAKRLLFAPADPAASPPGAAAVNVDDPFGERLAGDLTRNGLRRLISFSAQGHLAHYSAHEVHFDVAGTSFLLHGPAEPRRVELRLPGLFNVENALAAIACASLLGLDLDTAIAALGQAEPVPGRMEPVTAGQAFDVIVDYAHTPDSLENVLRAARLLTQGRLISVFGCGGDRDASKRPLMGRAGAELSDLSIVTSDNPRSENPDAIIAQILEGIAERERTIVEPDRRQAIALALGQAGAGDLVVIAGKGHEQGQELEGGRKIPFDDRRIAREEIGKLDASASGGGSA